MNQVKKLPLGLGPTPMQELRDFRDILGDGKTAFTDFAGARDMDAQVVETLN